MKNKRNLIIEEKIEAQKVVLIIGLLTIRVTVNKTSSKSLNTHFENNYPKFYKIMSTKH